MLGWAISSIMAVGVIMAGGMWGSLAALSWRVVARLSKPIQALLS